MKSKTDYTFRAKVLREEQDLLKLQRQSSLLEYANHILNETGEILPYLSVLRDKAVEGNVLFSACVQQGKINEYYECVKINHCFYKRNQRLRNRIEKMLTAGNCLFLTLTFTDNTLNETSPETRRRYVSRYLKLFGVPYVANIDFGKKNGREHYHAIICTDRIDFTPWHTYGAIDAEHVRCSDISTPSKLAKYIAKLSNHAIKETTKRSCLLYSR